MIRQRLAELTEILESINDTRQSKGFFAAIAQALAVIKERIYFKSEAVLFVRSVEEPVAGIKIIEGVTFREAQAQDLALFEPVVERSDFLWYRLLFERGRNCLIALKDEQLAAYVWLTPQIDPQVERTYVPLAPGDIYVIGIITVPAFRRRGFQKMLLKYLVEWAQERGYERIVSVVLTSNDVSLKLHNKLGYQPISRRTITKVLNLKRLRHNPNLFGRAGDVLILLW